MNGWSPTTITVDAVGEVVSVTVTEPRFTPAEKAVLLEARRRALAPRGQHGHLLSDATDPKNQYRWRAPLPRQDYAQAEINRLQDEYRKKYPDADLSSYLWRVELDD